MIFEVEDDGASIRLTPCSPFPPTRLDDGLGITGYSGPHLDDDLIQERLDSALQGKWKR